MATIRHSNGGIELGLQQAADRDRNKNFGIDDRTEFKGSIEQFLDLEESASEPCGYCGHIGKSVLDETESWSVCENCNGN